MLHDCCSITCLHLSMFFYCFFSPFKYDGQWFLSVLTYCLLLLNDKLITRSHYLQIIRNWDIINQILSHFLIYSWLYLKELVNIIHPSLALIRINLINWNRNLFNLHLRYYPILNEIHTAVSPTVLLQHWKYCIYVTG